MALDVKKILDDINPSDKVMKWLIVALVASITVIFGWGIKRGKSINDLEGLKKDYTELVIKVDALQKNTPKAIEAEISNEIKDVKIIVFKEIDDLEAELNDKITLVVSSQGEVTKEWLLKAIDIRARQSANFRAISTMNEVKSLSIESPMYNEESPIQAEAAPTELEISDSDRYDVYEIMEIELDIDSMELVNDSIELDFIMEDTVDIDAAKPEKKHKFSIFGIFKSKNK